MSFRPLRPRPSPAFAMALDVVPVRTGRELSRFIDVPWHVHDRARHPQWVPPLRLMVADALDVKKNPFYRTAERALWIAMRDGRPVGRIAAIANDAHNAYHKDSLGFFGFFEGLDDQEAATTLVDVAAEWL